MLCYCGAEETGRGSGGRIFLGFCLQLDLSPVLGVKGWPYVGMFHIAAITVRYTALRNTNRLQAKVIQMKRSARCIQSTCVDTRNQCFRPTVQGSILFLRSTNTRLWRVHYDSSSRECKCKHSSTRGLWGHTETNIQEKGTILRLYSVLSTRPFHLKLVSNSILNNSAHYSMAWNRKCLYMLLKWRRKKIHQILHDL